MNNTLPEIINPLPGSTVFVYDVQADETGALAILKDFYEQVKEFEDKTIKWIFVLSKPTLQETENIKTLNYPWTKKSWFHRLFFESITTKRIIGKLKPNIVFSLQNKGVECFKGKQFVYLHMAVFLTDHKFNIKTDGKRLWIYQKIISKFVVKSLKNKTVIVQTKWMKEALTRKTGIKSQNIIIQQPKIPNGMIKQFVEEKENYERFFYPAVPFSYKNHWVLLRAVKQAKESGLKKYEVILTIDPNENELSKQLAEYTKKNELNVTFMGKTERERVIDLYTKSVLVFPSFLESFGLPILEAKLANAPIIASDTQFAHEILGDYNRAEYFHEKDVDKLSQLLIRTAMMKTV